MVQRLSTSELAAIPFRDVTYAPLHMRREYRSDGTQLLFNEAPKPDFEPTIIRSLMANAERQPSKVFLAEREGGTGPWQRVTFGEAGQRVQALAQWLLNQGMDGSTPLMILASNTIAHALWRFAGMAAGVPVCPVSVQYGRMGGDFDRLRHVVGLVKPRLVFVEPGAGMNAALAAIQSPELRIISETPAALDLPALDFADLLTTEPSAEVTQRIAAADPDAPVAYMLTSGSTGPSKAVIHTMRMQANNLHLAHAALGDTLGWNDVMLDWLPWSHVAGTSNLLAAAVFGGTMHIDAGKPLPGLFEATLRNLREVAVPYFANVPSGYAMLTDALEAEPALCETFFSKLRLILYGGAALPQSVQDRLQSLAVHYTGHRIAFTTGYGATESCSGILFIYFPTDKVGIGLPPPGAEVKLVPLGDRYELRLRGDFVMPGYLHNPEKTTEAFDEEGFYRTGDTARFHNEEDPAEGLVFADRLAEEFKLDTGTFVPGGEVRGKLIEALAPAITDLVLCGENRGHLAALGIASEAGLRSIAGDSVAPAAALFDHPAVIAHVRERLRAYNAANSGRSKAVPRFAFLQRALDPNRHELSDKGSVNQAMALLNHADEVEALYQNPPPATVICAED